MAGTGDYKLSEEQVEECLISFLNNPENLSRSIVKDEYNVSLLDNLWSYTKENYDKKNLMEKI